MIIDVTTPNPFPDDTDVLVKFPSTADTDPEEWPWLGGYIAKRAGEDEWVVVVTDPNRQPPGDSRAERLLSTEDGHPICFRDRSELRIAHVVDDS